MTLAMRARPAPAEIAARTGPGSRAEVDVENQLRPAVDAFEGEERR